MDTQLRSVEYSESHFSSPILLDVVHGVEEILHVVDEVLHLILGPVAVAFRVLGTVALARFEEVFLVVDELPHLLVRRTGRVKESACPFDDLI